MKTLGRAAIGALLGIQALSPISASAQEGSSSSGGTAVKVDGSVVTITVTIDLFIGGVGTTELPEGAQEVAGTMASDIESYWNQAFARYGTDCLELRLDVIINALPNTLPPPSILYLGEGRPAAFVTKPGHHVIFWGEGNAYGNIPPPETYDPYDDDGVAPPGEDYGSPFDHELWAIWSPYLENSRDLAHEFGHLLGFGDDRANGDPLPGREGTLMADGDLIDQNLVNRLTVLARDAGNALPECWKGSAKITSSAVYPDAASNTCRDGWKVEFAFAASPEGTIDGQGTAELTSGPTCPFPTTGVQSWEHVEFRVLGEETSGGFSLRFALGAWKPADGATLAGFGSMFGNPALPSGGPPVVVAVSGTSGVGEGMWQFQSGNPPAAYSANGTIAIECATCEEAVG
jgi:hypothetical protein